MKVCPNCGHRIYDESLTVCPYCVEDVSIKEKEREDEFIKQLYKTTCSEDDAAKKYLKTVSVIEIISYLSVILIVLAFVSSFGYGGDASAFFVGLVVGVIAAVYGVKHLIAHMRMIANMAQDMHTTALANLLMLMRKADETNDNPNQTRLTETEKQEFLSEQTIIEIRDEINGIETQHEIANLEKDMDKSSEAERTQELEQRYTAQIKQASDRIIPLENEIMGFYEQFLQIVDARKNPIEPAPSGRRRRQG